MAGRWEEAEGLFSEILGEGTRIKRDYYQSAEPNYYLGRIAVKRGNPELGMAEVRKDWAVTPGYRWILAQMAVVSGDERYRERLLRYFDDVDAQFLLGVSYLETGCCRIGREMLLVCGFGRSGFPAGSDISSCGLGKGRPLDRGHLTLFEPDTEDRGPCPPRR